MSQGENIIGEIKPKLLWENIEYFRIEKENYITIRSKIHPEMHEIVLNSTSNLVMHLSDGTRSIDEIVSDLSKQFDDVNPNIIKKDIINLIYNFLLLNLIDLQGDNPFINKYEQKIDEKRVLSLCTDEDVDNIHFFINNVVASKEDEFSIYCNPLLYDYKVTRNMLNSNMFNNFEKYYKIMNEGCIESLLCIRYAGAGKRRTAEIKSLITPKSYNYGHLLLSYGMSLTTTIHNNDIVGFYCYSEKNNDDLLHRTLAENGFKLNTTLYNEIGSGEHIDLYRYIFDN